MSSIINHPPEQTKALAETMLSTTSKVTSPHEVAVEEFQMNLRLRSVQIRQLEDIIAAQEEIVVRRESDLMRDLLKMRIEKEKYEGGCSGCTGMRKKHEAMMEEMMEERDREIRMTEQAQLDI